MRCNIKNVDVNSKLPMLSCAVECNGVVYIITNMNGRTWWRRTQLINLVIIRTNKTNGRKRKRFKRLTKIS